MNLADELIKLGKTLSEERSAAHDLWTWLPSYKVAERHHGDYAIEHTPSNKDVMVEAAMYLGHLKHPEPLDPASPGVKLTYEEQSWFERCPCGKDHIPDE